MGMPLSLLLIILLQTGTALFIVGSADATDPIVSSKQPPLSIASKGIGRPVAAPPEEKINISSPLLYSPTKAPHPHKAIRPTSIAFAPSLSPIKSSTKKWVHGPASSQSISFYKYHHSRKRFGNSAPEPSFPVTSPKKSRQGMLRPSVSPFQSPLSSPESRGYLAPAPTSNTMSSHFNRPSSAPAISPSNSFFKKMMTPPPEMIMALPPPPPNEDCTSMTCSEPLTYTPPGLPCGCVWPIQVKLRLSIAINAFFPLVNELVEEIAASIALNHSQVRIMGADADSQQLEKSTALINLIPRGVKFNGTTAFLIYKKFWSQEVLIKPSVFGAYEVFYVQYPGLPPSPPPSHSSISSDYEGPNMGHNNNGRRIKPLGVDVHTKKRDGHGGIAIAVIAFSSLIALVICMAISWVLAIKCRSRVLPKKTLHASIPSPKPSAGSTKITKFGGKATSTLMTHRSGSLSLTYTGSAKTFTINDIKRATDNFNASRIVGEGGFGLVYKGTLDNGTEVAVKILKRNDQHGGREFFAEVEMLSRLHHRNLVKLIGICTEEHTHCLIYELIRNGSVASHLHGTDKGANPLDWDARIKIALGAARGLAYLHEDSSPRVIHRDFKSSNILLEYDFTPKVSDFGLARTALEEGARQVSTHVMGTFGYLAPEYAMTGHLLVKSDVYSYGVVLLELLTGRKPVDLAQPAGQENLVAYARPLLTNREGLETIIDPSIKSSVSLDNVTKVAAIASMCIQAEVSHRPFMGEVVQALKLVCNELDETKEAELTSCGKDSVLINVESNTRTSVSASDFLSNSMGHEGEDIQPFRRHSTSGNLTTGRRKQLWQILTSFSSGSTSDQLGYSLKSPQGKH